MTAVPGIFTIDDGNYLVNALALQKGAVTIANTADLPASSELLFFDPVPWTRVVTTTPVGSSAPPLYGPLALPFSFGGWRGLVALNTMAFVATAILVFAFATRYSTQPTTGWIAAATCALGGFLIQYAQGVWPHALGVAIAFAGIFAISRLIDGESLAFGALGGSFGDRGRDSISKRTATGGRRAGALIWRRNRFTAAAAVGAGALGPLLVSAAINHARLGSWIPVSKGPGYFNVPALQSARASSWFDPAVMFWLASSIFRRGRKSWRIVGRLRSSHGAHYIGLALQKALLNRRHGRWLASC